MRTTSCTLLLSLAACAGPAREPATADLARGNPELRETPAGPATPAATAPAEVEPRLLGPAPWPASEGIGVESNGGRYWVVYIPSTAEIPLNEEFDVELRVFDGATRSNLVEAEITVDARMPAHGHGMKLDPLPVQRPDGAYDVPAMLLHMVGHWELYVDLRVGAFTERAQFDIDLE